MKTNMDKIKDYGCIMLCNVKTADKIKKRLFI